MKITVRREVECHGQRCVHEASAETGGDHGVRNLLCPSDQASMLPEAEAHNFAVRLFMSLPGSFTPPTNVP